MTSKKNNPSWGDVKTKLSGLDREGLLGLLKDMYSANKDNQTFLHTRFNLGDDVLKPYKTTIDRRLWPDVIKNQDCSVAKAKKAIADYKKAVGQPEGLAELMVFYCERAVGFSYDVGFEDEGYLGALVRMFEQGLIAISNVNEAQRRPLYERTRAICQTGLKLSYNVGDEMIDLFDQYGIEVRAHDDIKNIAQAPNQKLA